MNLPAEAMDALGAALLPVAAGLLFEELTFGGLVRLMLTQRPKTRKRARTEGRSSRRPAIELTHPGCPRSRP